MFGTMDQTSYRLMNQNETNMILTAIYKNMIMKSMKVIVATIQSSILESLEGVGSWTKLRRVVAWIILFKSKLRKLSKSLVKKSSSVHSLDTILNDKGLLCVVDRLKMSPFNFVFTVFYFQKKGI